MNVSSFPPFRDVVSPNASTQVNDQRTEALFILDPDSSRGRHVFFKRRFDAM